MIVRFLIALTFGICAIDVLTDRDPSAFVRGAACFTLLVAAGGACGLLEPRKASPARVEVICPTCGRDILDPTTRLECDHPFSVTTERARTTHGRKAGETRNGWLA